MATEIYLPQLGLTTTEGVVVRWLKKEGDRVQKSEPVLEIESDKATVEIEAPAEGILGPVIANEGDTIPVGGTLGFVLEPGETSPTFPSSGSTSPSIPSTSPEENLREEEKISTMPHGDRGFASPRARRLAFQMGINLSEVEASGPAGRIVEADIRWFADQQKSARGINVSPVAQRLASQRGIDLTKVEGTGPGGRITKDDVEGISISTEASIPVSISQSEEIEPLRGYRRVMADRVTQSFTSAPHFYLTSEVDATAIVRLREGLLDKIKSTANVRLTITDILVKLCAQALQEFPEVNASWVETPERRGILRHSQVNIGIAMATDAGLVVPVIHQANQLTLANIAKKRSELIDRARANKLTPQDLEGGVFTLTNLGMYGIDFFHAIINPPQSAILAVGRIRERPAAIESVVTVRPLMYMTLAVDHRVLDGVQGSRFLERITQLTEEPYLLLD